MKNLVPVLGQTEARLPSGEVLLLPCSVNYYYITDQDQLTEAVADLLPIAEDSKKRIAVDIETTGFDPLKDDVVLLQIGTEDNYQYVFDARFVDLNWLYPVLAGPALKLGHNLKFDGKFIRHKFCREFANFFDTYLAEQLIQGGGYGSGRRYGLSDVTKMRLGKEMRLGTQAFIEGESTEGKIDHAKKHMQKSFEKIGKDEVLSEAQIAYAAHDVSSEVIFALADEQTKILRQPFKSTLYDERFKLYVRDPKLYEIYAKAFPPKLSLWNTARLEFKFLEVIIDMELAGIYFDKKLHREFLRNVEADYEGFRYEFLKLLGTKYKQKTLFGTASINPDSNKQVLEALNGLGLELEDTGAKGLELKNGELVPDSPEAKIVGALLSYRTMSKLLQAFGTKLSDRVHPVTGRIHPEIQQIINTGRMSMKEPNLQQMPASIDWQKTGDPIKDKEIAERKGLRECFQPKSGYKFIIFDYSMQELRIAASISLDPLMLQAFAEDKDLHSFSASLIYGDPYDYIEKKRKTDHDIAEKRKKAKILNFSCLYGTGPGNLSRQLNISLEEARELLDQFWASYPKLHESMQQYGKLATEYGYSNTGLGRKRSYQDLLNKIKFISLEKSPKRIQEIVTDLAMSWILEAGDITYENLEKTKQAIIKRYVGEIYRQSGNHAVQGLAADMMKIAAVNIRRGFLTRKLDAKIVALIHDEVIVEAVENDVEEAKAVVRDSLLKAMKVLCPNVPPAASGDVSDYWKK